MQGREYPSIYESSPVLFTPTPKNIRALQESSLAFYCLGMVSFSKMLATLHEVGLFTQVESTEYTMQQFLNTYFSAANSCLDLSPLHLLAQPLPEIELSATDSPSDIDVDLSETVNCYREMLGDILCNVLAGRPYEDIRDQENVSEQMHALQAGKIALVLGMKFSDVMAMLFHDIARPSVDSASHGHANHCQEGSTILSPLGLNTDYSGYHALAKYLLYTFCPKYKGLISSVSEYSLSFQDKKLQEQCLGLNHLDSSQLASFLFKIMFMRLIDDMSKVPELELRKLLGHQKADYFSPEMIQRMLKNQLSSALESVVASKNREESIKEMKDKLEAAMLLMLRAKSYSNQPHLYDKYHSVIAPLLKHLIDTPNINKGP